MNEKTVTKHPKKSKPENGAELPFVDVPRSLLSMVKPDETREQCVMDSVVWTLCRFRAHYRKQVTVALVAALTGRHRTTAWRALIRLRERGWIDADNVPLKNPPPSKAGTLRVMFAEVRELGAMRAAMLAQSRCPPPREARTNEHGSRMPSGMLASMFACCRDTVRRALCWLEAHRYLRLTREPGEATRVWVRGERERAAAAPIITQPLAPRVRANVPEPSWLDGVHELLKRKAVAPPGAPPPAPVTP